jgi:hypothetical protein
MTDWTTFDASIARWKAMIARAPAAVDTESIGPLALPEFDLLTLDAHCRTRHGLRVLSMHRSPEWLDAWQSLTAWATHDGLRPYRATEEDEAYLASLPGWILVIRPLDAPPRPSMEETR